MNTFEKIMKWLIFADLAIQALTCAENSITTSIQGHWGVFTANVISAVACGVTAAFVAGSKMVRP